LIFHPVDILSAADFAQLQTSLIRDRSTAPFASRIFAQDVVLPAKVTVALVELLLSLYQIEAAVDLAAVSFHVEPADHGMAPNLWDSLHSPILGFGG